MPYSKLTLIRLTEFDFCERYGVPCISLLHALLWLMNAEAVDA